jgi:hypothetical protein
MIKKDAADEKTASEVSSPVNGEKIVEAEGGSGRWAPLKWGSRRRELAEELAVSMTAMLVTSLRSAKKDLLSPVKLYATAIAAKCIDKNIFLL